MAILIKILLSDENAQYAEYAFIDHTHLPVDSHQGRVRLAKESGDISILDGGGYSNAVLARVIYKLRQHWTAKELPRETSFAA